MTVEIVVPQVGEAVDEVMLVRWFKQEGEAVRKGDPLFEIDTDKVTVEVEAFDHGVLQKILVPPNTGVTPQQVVGLLAPSSDSAQPQPPSPAPSEPKQASNHNWPMTPLAQRVAVDLGVNPAGLAGSGLGGRIMAGDVRDAARGGAMAHTGDGARRALATPKARRRAQELGVALADLVGTGADGLIRADDVERAAPSHVRNEPMPDGIEPLSRLRQAIASATQASKRDVPHFYLLADVEMTQVQRLRSYCSDVLGWPAPPTYTSVIVRACALALAAMPSLNVTLTAGGLLRRASVDIGVAVSIEGGLLTPVIARADQLGLQAISAQLGALAERARRNALRPDDLGAKSLVVSNLGMYAVDAFIAIIEPPAPLILAVGRVAERIVPVNGAPAVRSMCTLTLSADHRVLDGAPAAQFLTRVVQTLENPFAILGDLQEHGD
jgi:pyruvate dehydrogenase E2 component (dihydrolipoamide acetyltransferase)